MEVHPRVIRRAVAVLTLAVVASPFAAGVISGQLAGCPCPIAGGPATFAHALWHLLWGGLTLAIALGISRFRRASPATGLTERNPTQRLQSSTGGSTAPDPNLLSPVRVSGPNQYQLLTRAQRLAIASAAGQLLASAGANFNEGDFAIVHNAGELLALGSLGILLLVCLQLLGRVRGALPPTAHPS
jgi:hypothetical protein